MSEFPGVALELGQIGKHDQERACGRLSPMPDQEPNYKKLLTEYHRALMDIYRELKKAKNEQPGEKDQAASKAGMDFSAIVSDFHSRHGRLIL